MSGSSLRRLLSVAATTAALGAVALPSPALAGERFFSKSSSTVVSTSWLEVGQLPGVDGNAHIGELQVEDLGRGRARVFGYVVDLTCADGQVPSIPGGHGEEPVEGACAVAGERFVEGGQVTFTIDKKLTAATLTGTLAVGSGHGDPTVSPPVNITWTGVGATYSEKVTDSGVDEFGTYRFSYSFTGRQAVVGQGSRIGAMVFDDEAGESSEAQMGTQRSSSRSRS
jgi:hypothetical protein